MIYQKIELYCQKILDHKAQFFTFCLWEFTLLSLSDSYAVCSGIGC